MSLGNRRPITPKQASRLLQAKESKPDSTVEPPARLAVPVRPTASLPSRILAWLLTPRWRRTYYAPFTMAEPIAVPSAGDIYDFSVRLRCGWTGVAFGVASLTRHAEPYRAAVWESILEETRRTMRSFPPEQALDAERELNERLAALAENAHVKGGRLTWSARAEISVHDGVQRLHQEKFDRVFARAAEHAFSETLIEYHRERVADWQKLLADIGINTPGEEPPPFLARYLLRLAHDPNRAPDIVDDLSVNREEKDEELVAIVLEARDAAERAGLLEFEAAYDSALKRLMDWAGLPLPDHLASMLAENGHKPS